jgi:polyether ionophore transport system ATP-binding protein
VDDVIRTGSLRKTFAETRAIDGLDLSVAPGEVLGFLWAQRRRQNHYTSAAAGSAAQRRRRSSLLGADPWRDAVELYGSGGLRARRGQLAPISPEGPSTS